MEDKSEAEVSADTRALCASIIYAANIVYCAIKGISLDDVPQAMSSMDNAMTEASHIVDSVERKLTLL